MTDLHALSLDLTALTDAEFLAFLEEPEFLISQPPLVRELVVRLGAALEMLEATDAELMLLSKDVPPDPTAMTAVIARAMSKPRTIKVEVEPAHKGG